MSSTAFVLMMAEREDTDAAQRIDQPPHHPPNLSDYQSSHLATLTSFARGMAPAMAPAQVPIRCDSMSREILGLLDRCGLLREGAGIATSRNVLDST